MTRLSLTGTDALMSWFCSHPSTALSYSDLFMIWISRCPFNFARLEDAVQFFHVLAELESRGTMRVVEEEAPVDGQEEAPDFREYDRRFVWLGMNRPLNREKHKVYKTAGPSQKRLRLMLSMLGLRLSSTRFAVLYPVLAPEIFEASTGLTWDVDHTSIEDFSDTAQSLADWLDNPTIKPAQMARVSSPQLSMFDVAPAPAPAPGVDPGLSHTSGDWQLDPEHAYLCSTSIGLT